MAKQGKTLQEMAAELARQSEARKDFIAPQGALQAVVAEHNDNERGEVVLSGINHSMKILPHAHKQFADVLGIPGRYYDRMRTEQPQLLADNINTWFKAEPVEKRMVRTLDGRVRAILSPKYRPLDNFELANATLPKLIALGAQVVSSELTETRMYIKAILPELSDALPEGMIWGNGHNAIAEYGNRQGGRICAAIVISNSEVGDGALRIEPSVFTTWCTNLAVMKAAAMRKYHVGRGSVGEDNFEVFRDATREADDRAFFMKVADITEAAFRKDLFEAAVAQLRNATKDKIESPNISAVVETTVRTLALPASTQNSILTYLAQGGDMSRWGLASAVTATANNFADYEGATQLERAGGEILALPAKDWASIATAA